MSFVRGGDVDFLHARFEALSKHPLFAEMEWADDHARIAEWAPLLEEGRGTSERVAATRSRNGTDVDFGALTKQLFAGAAKEGVELLTATP